MLLSSSVLKPNKEMPTTYTCYGRDISPPLHWHHLPADTRSLVILMIDKDAPEKHRYLWALYDVSTERNWIDENAQLLRGERYAKNSWGDLTYRGPCPSKGTHHYAFELYALKVRFYFHRDVSVPFLLQEMKHRVISTATLNVHYTTNNAPNKTAQGSLETIQRSH